MEATLVLHRRNGLTTSFGLVEGTLPDEAYFPISEDRLYRVKLPDDFEMLTPQDRIAALDEAVLVNRAFSGQVSTYPEVNTQIKMGGRVHRQIRVGT